tara:strand:+ start:344 stop:556 length:213 start_codon:yes stop_codon:yes gene_type:complete
MEPSTIAILLTGILNLLATLRQSRCTDIHSDCCFGLCSIGIERDVVEQEGVIPFEAPVVTKENTPNSNTI